MKQSCPIKIVPALVILMALGCSGVKTSKSAPGAAQEAPVPALTLDSDQLEACDAFFSTIDRALRRHLTRTPDEGGKLVAVAVNALLDDTAKKDADSKTQVDSLFPTRPTIVSDCAPLLQLASLNIPKDKDLDPLTDVMTQVLAHFAKAADAYSHYNKPRSLSGIGTGVRLAYRTDYALFGRKPKYYVLSGLFDDSPNREILKGKVGAHILKIAGKGASEWTFGEAWMALNSIPEDEKDRVVDIVLEGVAEPVHLIADKLEPSFTSWKRIDDPKYRMAYIRIEAFTQDSAQSFLIDWVKILQGLSKGGSGPLGILLDLRGNLGGYADEAKKILDNLIDEPDGILFVLKTVLDIPNMEAQVAAGRKLTMTIPYPHRASNFVVDSKSVVILSDRGSASASEVVLGSLRDWQRALIVGETSYGKGIGQVPIDLPSPLVGDLHITASFSYSPSGNSPQLVGITPDIPIEDLVLTSQQKEPVTMRERKSTMGNLIISAPSALKTGFKKPASPAISNETLEKMKKFKPERDATCRDTPDSTPKFREEDDCLYSMGILSLRKLMELQTAEGVFDKP